MICTNPSKHSSLIIIWRTSCDLDLLCNRLKCLSLFSAKLCRTDCEFHTHIHSFELWAETVAVIIALRGENHNAFATFCRVYHTEVNRFRHHIRPQIDFTSITTHFRKWSDASCYYRWIWETSTNELTKRRILACSNKTRITANKFNK